MDRDQLSAFDRIVRDGSFSRAAWALEISQPAISARLQALEQELGGPLLVRGGRHLALTPLGESFLPYARRALEVMAEGVEAARLTQAGHRGKISLGTLESLASGLVVAAVVQFRAARPGVDLSIHSGDQSRVVSMLGDGLVDLALVSWPDYDLPAGTAAPTPLLRFREPIVLVVGANHPLAGLTVSLDEVAHRADPFLTLHWTERVYEQALRVMTTTQSTVEVPINTARQLLVRGIGAAFMTRTFIADALAAGRLAEVVVSDAPPLSRGIALFGTSRRGGLSPVAADFVEVLRDEARALCLLEE